MNDILDKILNEICLDGRITNGIFNIEENLHIDILREYFINKGIDEELVREYCNKVVEGKYPEKQAYNSEGLLITFPSPSYKARAIKRGTHFEKDPTKAMPNVFGGSESPQQSTSNTTTDNKQQSINKTSLPLSQITDNPSDEISNGNDTKQPVTTMAPSAAPLPEEPITEPTELSPLPKKSDKEKEADKQAIIKMIKTNDMMLEKIVEYVLENRSIPLCCNIISESRRLVISKNCHE